MYRKKQKQIPHRQIVQRYIIIFLKIHQLYNTELNCSISAKDPKHTTNYMLYLGLPAPGIRVGKIR